MPNKIFITGTDTDVGKTYVSVALLNALKQAHYKTIALKPIASGAHIQNGKLYNQDALALQHAATVQLPYDHINPYIYEPAIAPNIAADQLNQELTVTALKHKTALAFAYPADFYLIEGVGGWHVPLNDKETMADFVIQETFSVILVVGIRLGCLNHAILTAEALQKANVPVYGWIANIKEPIAEANAIIDTLKKWLKMPYLSQLKSQETLNYKTPWINNLLM